MTHAVFAAELIKTCLKPLVSGVLSLSMAFSPVLPQNQGTFLKLAADSLLSDTEKVRIQVNYNIKSPGYEMTEDGEDVDVEYTAETMSGDLDIYADIQNLILNVYLDEEKKNAIYIDTDGYALSPSIGEIYLMSEYSDGFYDYDQDELTKVHTEGFADKYYGESWEKYFEDELYGIDLENRITPESAKAGAEVFSDIFSLLTTPENTALIGDICKDLYAFTEEYFYTETRGTAEGFGLYLDGMDVVSCLYDTIAVIDSEEYREAQGDLMESIIDKMDIEGYSSVMYGENRDTYPMKNGCYDMMSMVLPSVSSSEAEEMLAVISEIRAYASVANIPEQAEAMDVFGVFESLYTMLSGSYIDIFAYPNGDDICLDIQLVLHTDEAMGDAAADIKCIISEYDGELQSSASFTDRYTISDCISKLINGKATEKGIYKAEMEWWSEFDDRYDEPAISDEDIYVWYMEDDMKAIFTSPSFPSMSEENRNNIIELFESKYYFDYDYNHIDVELIDNSTYLPLRQIAESCGLTVEWDGEAKKAYVIKDGTRVDMTGTLVGNKTYVKVRDFEKLGATVEYDETVYDGDDGAYEKISTVTISFFTP